MRQRTEEKGKIEDGTSGERYKAGKEANDRLSGKSKGRKDDKGGKEELKQSGHKTGKEDKEERKRKTTVKEAKPKTKKKHNAEERRWMMTETRKKD